MIFHKQMDYPTPPSEAQNYRCMPLIDTTQATTAPGAAANMGLWPQDDSFLTIMNILTEL